MHEYVEAILLGAAGGLSKGILGYAIEKKLDVAHWAALAVLGGVIALGLLPFSRRVTSDANIQDLIVYRGGLLAPNIIALVEKKLPNLLSFIIDSKKGQ